MFFINKKIKLKVIFKQKKSFIHVLISKQLHMYVHLC